MRSTSHKPDEIYGLIERLSPGTRKIGKEVTSTDFRGGGGVLQNIECTVHGNEIKKLQLLVYFDWDIGEVN